MDLEELIPKLCERPGMYVGKAKFEYVVLWIYGFDCGFEQGVKQGNENPAGRRWSEMRRFDYWLKINCFPFKPFSFSQGWDTYIPTIFPNDDEAFLILPILFREFKTAEREAGGSEELEKRLSHSLINFEELMADDFFDDKQEPLNTEFEKQLSITRAAMRGVLDAAARSEERPLAAHIAHVQDVRAEQKARAAVLFKAAQEMHPVKAATNHEATLD